MSSAPLRVVTGEPRAVGRDALALRTQLHLPPLLGGAVQQDVRDRANTLVGGRISLSIWSRKWQV
jgi:hypothetical protein